jgi:hypothetical protein
MGNQDPHARCPMTRPPDSALRAICDSILQYLHKHPEAADSQEGIVSWWLPQSGYAGPLEAVHEALDLLVAERRIARIDLADGRTLYQSVDKVSGAHPTWKPHPPKS